MMKKTYVIFIALVIAMIAPLAAVAQVVDHDVKVGDFDVLILQDNIDVIYKQDAKKAGHVTFKSTKKVADCLIFVNNGKGKLKIEVAEDMLGKEHTPTLTVYSSGLHWCENDADSTLTIEAMPKRDEFGAHLTGNGKVVVKKVDVDRLRLNIVTSSGSIVAHGKCDVLNARVLGSAEIDALDVVATNVNAHATGVGSIKCNVNGGDLNVKGSGKVYYKGSPNETKRRKLFGSLKVISLDHPELNKTNKKEEKKEEKK